jgi:[ribosomal protein S18]-alanine N-acetyltransferase
MRALSPAGRERPMQVYIRDATHHDLPRIWEIERLSFDQPWSLNSFKRELSLPFSRLVVASADGDDSAIGFLCRWLVASESHILNIAVRPDVRRLGIGAELLLMAVDEAKAKSACLVTLEVRRSNLAARSFYRKFDFEERRLRRNYYAPGEDAIVMELRFD